MRNIAHGALAGAREILDGFVKDVRDDNKMSDDELLSRYITLHQGQPKALTLFAAENAPKGSNPVEQAWLYETKMEKLLADRGYGAKASKNISKGLNELGL